MSENCNHDCSSCGENCESRQQSFLKPLHEGAASLPLSAARAA